MTQYELRNMPDYQLHALLVRIENELKRREEE
jgi:hypothetical protein